MTLIYCGQNGEAGKALAATIRRDGGAAGCRDSITFNGDAQQCDQVIVMDDVPVFYRDRLNASYGEKVLAAEIIPMPKKRGRRAQ